MLQGENGAKEDSCPVNEGEKGFFFGEPHRTFARLEPKRSCQTQGKEIINYQTETNRGNYNCRGT